MQDYKKAKNDFKKSFLKLMNNVVSEKTFRDMRKKLFSLHKSKRYLR